MASEKFSAFQFASEEFNSDLAKLVNGFTQSLVKLITEECARNETNGEDSESDSRKSLPFSSPTGKAPRKKAALKRGRPSKGDTGVEIDDVDDVRNVSDELEERIEMVRSSSKSPRVTVDASKFESMPVSLDDLIIVKSEIVHEETLPTKKGKAKAPKEKKEKVVKVPKAPKEKKGKKNDEAVVALHEEIVPVQEITHSTSSSLDDDDNDGLDEELANSQSVDLNTFEKLTTMANGLKIGGDELVEEHDYANVTQSVDGIMNTLESVIANTSAENSQDDDIVIGDDGSEKDDMSQPPPEDEDEDDEDEDDGGDVYNGDDDL